MDDAQAVAVMTPHGALVPEPDVDDAGAVLAAGSRSFHFASLFLPADRRADAALLYTFCRYVDDVADEAPDVEAARAGLEILATELLGEAPPRRLVATVLALFERRRIDVRHALDLIDGVASDLDEVRIADDAELIRYSYRVASTVGLMMCGVLGVRDPHATPHALDLGVAMQITNICRDVAEDAHRGRVYLPATRLRALGVPQTPDAVLGHRDAVRRIVFDLLGKAERFYVSGEDGMHHIPWRARLAILVAARVYRAIGRRLLRHGGDALAGRTVVPLAEKAWVALGALADFVRVSSRRRRHRASLHRALVGWPGADPDAREE